MDALVMCGGSGTRLASDCEKPLYPVAGRPMVSRVLTALYESDVESIYLAVSPHTPDTKAYLQELILSGSTETLTASSELIVETESKPEPHSKMGADHRRANGTTPIWDTHGDGSNSICDTSGERSISIWDTPGDGYVEDVQWILSQPDISRPILTVAADLPLLDGATIDRIIQCYDGDGSMTVCVPVSLKRRLGASVDSRLETKSHLTPTGVNVVGSTDETMVDVYDDRRLAINVNRREDALLATEAIRCD